MRTFLVAIIVGAFLSIGAGMTPAFANCAEAIEKAKTEHQRVKRNKKKAMVQKIEAAIKAAEKAKASGDMKGCNSNANKAFKQAKRL